MNNSQGALYFGAGIDRSQWNRDIESMRRDILGLNNTVRNETRQIDSSFKSLSLGIAGYFSVNALKGFAMELINIRGEFQKTEIAFSTMLGDGVKAKELMGEMVTLAAKTPFSLQDVSAGAKQLLAFQVPANEVVDTLTRMGNIAAGLSVPLSRINLVYGQVKAKDKLMGDDLRQFTEAGIPMVAELAKKFGKTTGEIQAMVSAGKIGFKDVKDVLFSMTNEGGMFFNLMEKQSKSLSGQIANLGDSWDQMLNKIGESNDGLISDSIEGLNYLVANYEEVGTVLETLIETYGAYRVALALTAAMQGKMATPALIQGFSNLIKLIRGATVAQAALNSTTLANPYILLATGIAAVVAVCYNYRQELGELIGVIDKATEKTIYQEAVDKKFNQTFSQGIVEKRSKIESLIAVINNENSKLDDRKRAYEKLIALDSAFRNTLDNQYRSTLRLGDAFDHVIKKMQAMAMAQAEIAVKAEYLQKKAQADFDVSLAQVKYDEGERQIKEWAKLLKEGKIDIKEYADRVEGIDWDKTRKDLIEAKKAQAEITKETNYANKAEENKLKTLKAQETVLLAQLNGGKVQGKPISDGLRAQLKKQLDIVQVQLGEYSKKIEETVSGSDSAKLGIIEKLQEELKAVNDAIDKELDIKNLPALRNKRDTIQKRLDELLGKKGKSDKQIAEILPIGSIKELQRRAQLIQDAIDVAVNGKVKLRRLDKYGNDKDNNGNPLLTGKIVSEKEAYKLQDEINELIKKLQRKSFDEQLAEEERQWNIRYKLAKEYGEEIAKAQFPDLKGDSYFDSIKKQYDDLSNKIELSKTDKKTIISKADLENALKLKDILDSLTGTKDRKTQFFENLDSELSKLKTFSEKKLLLDSSTLNLSGTQKSTGYLAELFNRQEDLKKSFQETFDAILEEQKSYEEKSLELTRQYNEIKDSEQYKNASPENQKKIDKGFKEKQGVLDMDFIQKSKEWEVAFSELEGMSRTSLQRILEKLLEFQQKSKGTLSIQDAAKLQEAIDNVRNAANKNPFQKLIGIFQQYREALKITKAAQLEYNKALQDYNKAVETYGKDSQQAKEALDNLNKAGAKAIDADKRQLDSKKRLVAGLQSAQDIFNSIGQGVLDIADAFGGLDDASKDAVEDIMAIGNAAFDLAKSIASGDVSGMIKAGIQLIGSIAKALNGDKKKERNIKRQAQALKELERAYNDLAYAAEKAFGAQKYSAQTDVIRNLEQQRIKLQQMISEESSKKKSDQGKIDEWKSQIQSINQSIDQIKVKIVEDVLQTSLTDAAAKIGDALVDAFGRGEDAVKSLETAANDMIKNLLKNQLNLVLQKKLEPILKQLFAATGIKEDGSGSFTGLTAQQIADFKAQVLAAGADMQQFLNAYSDIFSGLSGNASNLEGAIKGITSEEAGIIAGQMNAIRIMQAEALQTQKDSQLVLRNQLLQLTQIEINTRYLKLMYQIMDKVYGRDSSLRGSGII